MSQVQMSQSMTCKKLYHAIDKCCGAGAIKAIYSGIDFTKDGINEIALGRDTGSLEVYGFDQQQQPVLIFQASLEESITTIDGGFFASPNVQVVSMLTLEQFCTMSMCCTLSSSCITHSCSCLLVRHVLAGQMQLQSGVARLACQGSVCIAATQTKFKKRRQLYCLTYRGLRPHWLRVKPWAYSTLTLNPSAKYVRCKCMHSCSC